MGGIVSYRSTGTSRFYLYMAMLFIAIAIAGFSTTFFIPLARGTYSAPLIIHVHGALLFAWLILLLTQAALIQSRNTLTHRRIGWLGALIAAAIIISGVLVGAFATRRDLAAGGGDWLFGSFLNTIIEMILFGSLVGAAILYRRRTEIHKRLLLIATILILAPAWFRFRHFMPFVPNPFVTFSYVADGVLLVPIFRDWILFKRVHPVYLWAGGTIFVIHIIMQLVMEGRLWESMGRWLLSIPAV